MKKEKWNITAWRIKERLNTLRITQRELAEQTGKTEATISRWVKGNRIPLATEYPALAKALKCTCDYLLGLSNTPEMTTKEELLKELKLEEESCKICGKWQAPADVCESCATRRHIQQIESAINVEERRRE